MKKYVLTKYNGLTIGLLYADRILSDLHLYDKTESDLLGRIAIGRVRDLVPNIDAAFVEMDTNTICFLPLKEKYPPIFCNAKNTEKICCGDLLLLQINQEGVKTKAPTVTSNLSFTGRYVVLDRNNCGTIGVSKKISDKNRIAQLKELCGPYENAAYGIIVRTQAENAGDADILNELNSFSEQYLNMLKIAKTRTAFSVFFKGEEAWAEDLRLAQLTGEDEIITDSEEIYEALNHSNLFPKISFYEDSYPIHKLYQIDQILGDLLHKTVWLKSGASIVIEPCETMTVIDVNSSKAICSKNNKEEHYLEINKEAAKEIARQLRIRNISGMILVDFINMKDTKHDEELLKYFESELNKDSIRTQLVDMTKLGLVELTRKKKRRSNLQIVLPILNEKKNL